MKQEVLKMILDHAPYIVSGVSYSLLEFWLGKTKKLEANSLIELLLKNLWSKHE